MTDFDPEMFLNSTVEGEMETKYDPIPEGEYVAVVEEIGVRTTKTGKPILDVKWSIDDAQLAEQLNRQNLTVRQSVFLDLTNAGGLDLGPNKNIQLGRLREALGQNGSGTWSFRNLEGAGPAHIQVSHRRSDDGEQVYEDVKRVAKI